MRRFPGEEEQCNEVREALGGHFKLADRVFDSWLSQPKDEAISKSTLPTPTMNLAMALDVQATRLFRSVIEQCWRGEGQNGHIVSRTLFETVLTQGFLLAERIPIFAARVTRNGAVVPGQFRAKVCLEGDAYQRWLTREQRADLYLAHMDLEFNRDIERVAQFPGMEERALDLQDHIDPSVSRGHEAATGPEWSYILTNHPWSYSGLTVSALAPVVDEALGQWHRTIYGYQCRPVHANDLVRHLRISDAEMLGVKYLSTENE